jgi:MerR family redox-sensitive transcriptional activator SoxR
MSRPESELLPIGVVAERSGLAVSALRFYETHGLIESARTAGGQRRYHRDVLRRLAVIRAAQQVGFPLGEIAGMLAGLPADQSLDEAGWRALASSWRPQIDERIRVLERLRDQLDRCIGCGCLSMRTCRMANPDDRAGRRGSGPRFWLPTAAPGTSIAASDEATRLGPADGGPPERRR